MNRIPEHHGEPTVVGRVGEIATRVRPLSRWARRVRLDSMLPSATEIVYALGLGDDLVGVTFECDEPAVARAEKTIVVGGRDTGGLTPGEIDAYVRERPAAGDDLYTLHAGALAALDPDVILTQDLCRVCALPSGQVQDALSYLGCRADVVSLDPHSLDDVLGTIIRIGARTGADDDAARLVAGLRERLAAVATAVAGRSRPRVAGSSRWTRRSPLATGCRTWSSPPVVSRCPPGPVDRPRRPAGTTSRAPAESWSACWVVFQLVSSSAMGRA